jgi:tRNA U34 2-thiouridine synthase MnmA/TrmU
MFHLSIKKEEVTPICITSSKGFQTFLGKSANALLAKSFDTGSNDTLVGSAETVEAYTATIGEGLGVGVNAMTFAAKLIDASRNVFDTETSPSLCDGKSIVTTLLGKELENLIFC